MEVYLLILLKIKGIDYTIKVVYVGETWNKKVGEFGKYVEHHLSLFYPPIASF